ncbi:MAG: AzlD domain-containing protein [Actinomycetota bacterium]|nr:AzlD domain-containing protein [Actinomycetota bacterium]
MSLQAQFWLVVIVLAFGTWTMRSLPIMLHGHIPHPHWLERLLKYVPVAAMTALSVPGILYLKTNGVYHLAPERTVAGIIALAVALRTRNILATLVAGMVALWVAQVVLAAL